jgi:hypothetical protein
MSMTERIQALEASHIRLMTDHEVFLKEQEAAWRKHEAFVAKQDLEWERDRERWKEARERGRELDERISKMIGGIGEFMRQSKS